MQLLRLSRRMLCRYSGTGAGISFWRSELQSTQVRPQPSRTSAELGGCSLGASSSPCGTYVFMRDRRRSTVATCAFTFMHNTGQVFFLPTRFFFTHVLLAVLLNSAFRWLRRPASDKTKYYAMESWMVDVPIVLASFGEAFACDAWLSRFGGHVCFDMVVPVMFTAYLAVLVLTGDGSREAGLGT